MKQAITDLVFILDRSGSMAGLETDTIGGYNSLLKKQRKTKGQVLISTVLFDDLYQILHDRIPLEEVMPITDQEYYVRGSTALLDAVGKTIQRMIAAHRGSSPEERKDKVLFVITTDGFENASREYSYADIKTMIARQKEAGWEFLFLGANIDAVKEAARFGIDPARAAKFVNDKKGVELNYMVMSDAVSQFRTNHAISREWKERIEEDEEERGE